MVILDRIHTVLDTPEKNVWLHSFCHTIVTFFIKFMLSNSCNFVIHEAQIISDRANFEYERGVH